MNEGEVRFTTRAYDWRGKLLDDHSFIAKEQADIIYNVDGEDVVEFELDVLARYKDGEYDNVS